MLFSAFLILNVLGSVYGDFRVPILTHPLANFTLPFLQGFMSTNQAYYDRVTTYNVWQTPRAVGDQISEFNVIVGSTAQTMVFDADVLLQRGQLSVAILEQTKLYDCPNECYVVKDADLIQYTTLTSTNLVNVAFLTIGEIHQFAIETMEKKFCFNMTVLEQKLNLSSLRVINNEWALFVPDIVMAAVKCRADMLNVTVDELAELLNTNTATLHAYNLNQIENIFFPAFDDLVVRKNRFETQSFSVSISGQSTSQWQSQTMAYYANQISQFSVRHLEILYKWASAQLFAIENIQLSSYFSQCTSLSTVGSAFDLSRNIFGYQTTLPSCNVAFVLSRSLGEDELRFNLATITNRNILTIIRNASSISSWFDFYQLLFAISEGIWMETPLITQVQVRQSLTNAQILTRSVPQIAYAIRSLNRSGDLNLIMRDNYQQYFSLLLQTYGFTKSSLATLTGRTEAQIDSLTIQEAHNLVFEALYLRYNINEFLSKLTVAGVDNFVAINLPSFEWYILVRAAIESSFDQLANAFSTNLKAGTGGVSVVTLADGTSSIQIQSGSVSSSFVISASRLASCLDTTVSEIYQRTMPSYQTLYQSSAVDLMNRKIIFETQNLNALLTGLGITFDSIKDTETVGQTIENRVGLTAEQLRCMYGWSSEFTSFLFGITWKNVSSFRLCNDYTTWPLHRIAVALLHSSSTVCGLCSTGPCNVNADCTDTVGSYICTCRTGFTGNGLTCTDINKCTLGVHICGQNAACTNTPGSFVCTCNPGYTGDGLFCTDINECATNTHNCHANAACTNTISSFTCVCNVGFVGNGVICTDIDECISNPCQFGFSCENNPGSYKCLGQCKQAIDMAFAVDTSGSIGATNFNQIKEFLYIVVRDHDVGEGFAHFALIYFNDNATVLFNFNRLRGAELTATNINNLISMLPYDGGETSIDLALVRARDHVFTNAGGWRSAQNIPKVLVVITDGQQTPRGDQSASLAQLAANLKSKGVVIISVGIGAAVERSELIEIAQGVTDNVIEIDYFALLNKTDTLIERSCRAPNECDLYSPCHVNATCTDTEVSFECRCIDGYSGDKNSCVDINECALGINDCHSNPTEVTCTNTIGSFTCACNTGYTGDGKTCTALNSKSSSPSSSNIGVIIGVVVALTVVIVILAVALIIVCFFYRRKPERNIREDNVQNAAYEGDAPQPDTVYEEPSNYAQLDSSRRIPIDANYQTLIHQKKSEEGDVIAMPGNEISNQSIYEELP